jgi:biopolymer transport protein ExbD
MIRVRRQADETDEDDLDLTSMIDVTFLLLIFFMVTSVMSQKANPDLPKSVAGDTQEVDKQVMLVLDFPESIKDDLGPESFNGSKSISLSHARIYFRDSRDELIPANELAERLAAKLQEPGRSKTLILQASRQMPVGVVREVLKLAAAAGAENVSVAVWIPK